MSSPAIAPSRNITTGYLNPKDADKPENEGYAFLPNVKVLLTSPIEVGGVKMSEVTLRRPKVKDNKIINAMRATLPAEDLDYALIAHLCGLSSGEFEELDLADVALLGEWLSLFVSARKKH